MKIAVRDAGTKEGRKVRRTGISPRLYIRRVPYLPSFLAGPQTGRKREREV